MDTAVNQNGSNPKNPNKNVVVIAVLSAAIILLLGGVLFFGKKSGTNTNQSNGNAALPLPTEVAVQLTSTGFVPKDVSIKTGSAVRWTNSSGVQGTVNSDDHPTHKLFPEMNLGTFSSGSTLVHIFTKPGVYRYHDHFHPDFKGTVTVQ